MEVLGKVGVLLRSRRKGKARLKEWKREVEGKSKRIGKRKRLLVGITFVVVCLVCPSF